MGRLSLGLNIAELLPQKRGGRWRAVLVAALWPHTALGSCRVPAGASLAVGSRLIPGKSRPFGDTPPGCSYLQPGERHSSLPSVRKI